MQLQQSRVERPIVNDVIVFWDQKSCLDSWRENGNCSKSVGEVLGT